MPATLRRLALTLTLFSVLSMGAIAPATAGKAPIPDPEPGVNPATHLGEYAHRFLHHLNVKRAKEGLRPIRAYDTCVDPYTNRWAKRLARTEELVHRDLGVFLEDCSMSWAGETLIAGSGYFGPRAALRGWMHSPPHRAILLSPKARRAGVAFAYSESGGLYGVVNVVKK